MESDFSPFLLSYLIPLVLVVFVQDHEPGVVFGNQMANPVPFSEVTGSLEVVVVLSGLEVQSMVVEVVDLV